MYPFYLSKTSHRKIIIIEGELWFRGRKLLLNGDIYSSRKFSTKSLARWKGSSVSCSPVVMAVSDLADCLRITEPLFPFHGPHALLHRLWAKTEVRGILRKRKRTFLCTLSSWTTATIFPLWKSVPLWIDFKIFFQNILIYKSTLWFPCRKCT